MSGKYTLYLSKRVTNVDSGHFYPDSVLHLPIFLRDFTHLGRSTGSFFIVITFHFLFEFNPGRSSDLIAVIINFVFTSDFDRIKTRLAHRLSHLVEILALLM